MGSQAGTEFLKKLRIAVVLDSSKPPAWVASIIRKIEPKFVAILPPAITPSHSFLFARYLACDAQRTQIGLDPLAPVTLPNTVIYLTSEGLAASETDVVLWLSETDPANSPPITSRYGTLFFQHGQAGCTDFDAAYFTELMNQEPLTSCYLLLQKQTQFPILLNSAHTATVLGWSLAAQRVAPFWKAEELLLQSLSCINESDTFTVTPKSRLSNRNLATFAVRNAARTTDRRLRFADKESHWYVTYRTNKEDFVSQNGSFTGKGLQTLPTPDGHFYADPFVLTWRGRTFLFVEDYLYEERRGVLSVLELQPDGTFTPAREILNKPYHLSYPFIFEQDGEVFLIPESMAGRRIELYRAVEMPHRWTLEKVLQENIEAVDTTLWTEDGVFYFFTSLAKPGLTPNDLLHLFTASSLTGEWRPHPANPVSLDVRNARGAGKLFRIGDKLVRPAQDCSVRYGYATQLNEVEVLSPEKFREKSIFRIEPDWAPALIGTHTINSNDALEVIDGQVYRPKYRKMSEEK